MAGLKSWSRTAASNVLANTGFTMDENMAPSAVNDSVRQLMADVKTEWAQGSAVASATTPDITGTSTTSGGYLHITGTTTITGFATADAGIRRRIVFDGILQLTHNATSFILLTGANITTAAGDCAEFVSEGSGNWRMTGYERASGAPLAGATTAATQADQEAASSTTLMVTPGRQQFHPSAAKAWVVFDGTGANGAVTVPAAQQYNIASVTKNGAGDYTVVVTTAFSSTQYATAISASNSTSAVFCFVSVATTPTSTTIRINVRDTSNAATNSDRVSVIMFGDQP